MAKTNKQQKEIDELIIERNNLIDTVEILEKGTRQIAKILGLDGIAENTYFNDADIETIEKAIEKLQGKYEKCFEELSMKCGECNVIKNKIDEYNHFCDVELEYKGYKFKFYNNGDNVVAEMIDDKGNNWKGESGYMFGAGFEDVH